MKNKILIIPNNFDNVMQLKTLGVNNFLFPIEKYSIGYSFFSVDEINQLSLETNTYLLINRVLTTKEIDELLIDIKQYKNIIGIFFEDLGVFQAFKDHNYKLISYQSHFNTNYHSLNVIFNDGLDSAVISNDITLSEISAIIDNTNKSVIPFIYGKSQLMYSRRLLVTNYNKVYNTQICNPVIIENVSKIEFKIDESPMGTVIYDNNYYNGTDIVHEINDDNVLYYLVNLVDLKDDEVLSLIKYLIDKNFNQVKNFKQNTNYGFLYRPTIYRVKKEDV